jgi:hypothetical protein
MIKKTIKKKYSNLSKKKENNINIKKSINRTKHENYKIKINSNKSILQYGGMFIKNTIYKYKNFYIKTTNDGSKSKYKILCNVNNFEHVLPQQEEEIKEDIINYSDVEEVKDKRIYEKVKEINKNNIDMKKISQSNTEKSKNELKAEESKNELTAEEFKKYKNILDNGTHEYSKITLEELYQKELLNFEDKKNNLMDILINKIKNLVYFSDFCKKNDIEHNNENTLWFLSRLSFFIDDFKLKMPMLFKNEQEYDKDLVDMILSFAAIKKKEVDLINTKLFQEEISIKDKEIIIYIRENFGGYELFSKEKILKKHEIGLISYFNLKNMKLKEEQNIYLRLGVNNSYGNILYHSLCEGLLPDYYNENNEDEIKRKITLIKQTVVFDTLTDSDSQIYYSFSKNDGSKLNPQDSSIKLRNYIEMNQENNSDLDISLLSSIFNINIFIINNKETPQAIERCSFKEHRKNVVLFKIIENDTPYYEPIIQLHHHKIDIQSITYNKFRTNIISKTVFNSSDDLIRMLLSKYIEKYSSDIETNSNFFQNFDISEKYLNDLVYLNYLSDMFKKNYKEKIICGNSELFPSEHYSIPIYDRNYECNVNHPFQFKIDKYYNGFQDICCTDDVNSDGVEYFISKYNTRTGSFEKERSPKGTYKIFNDASRYMLDRTIKNIVFENNFQVSYKELPNILPLFKPPNFKTTYQIKKFILDNKRWINFLQILTEKLLSSSPIIISDDNSKNEVNEKYQSINQNTNEYNFREYFSEFYTLWRTFRTKENLFLTKDVIIIDTFIDKYIKYFEDLVKKIEEQKKEYETNLRNQLEEASKKAIIEAEIHKKREEEEKKRRKEEDEEERRREEYEYQERIREQEQERRRDEEEQERRRYEDEIKKINVPAYNNNNYNPQFPYNNITY